MVKKLSWGNTKRPQLGDNGPEMDPMISERNIRRVSNDIYFFDVVDDETQLILQQMLKQASAEFYSDHIYDIMAQNVEDSITIHLNSPGGYAYSGLALYDYIKAMSEKVPISCIVEGTCASAASLIFLACEERDMSNNSVFLIHQCSWGGYGENRYMQDEAQNSRLLMHQLKTIYLNETLIGADRKTDKERDAVISDLLSHDIYLTRQQCLEHGIIRLLDKGPTLSKESMKKLNKYANDLFKQEQKTKNSKIKGKTKSTEKKENKKAKEAKPKDKSAPKP